MAKQLSGDEVLKEEFETKAKVQVEDEPKFTKEQLLNSKKYINTKDILTALLTEGESYTHSEVSRLTEEFLKGEIK